MDQPKKVKIRKPQTTKTPKGSSKKKVTNINSNKNKNKSVINININSNNKTRKKSTSSSSNDKKPPIPPPSIIFNPSLVIPQPIYQQLKPPVSAPVSAPVSSPAITTTGIESRTVDRENFLKAIEDKARINKKFSNLEILTNRLIQKTTNYPSVFPSFNPPKFEESSPSSSEFFDVKASEQFLTETEKLLKETENIISKPVYSTPPREFSDVSLNPLEPAKKVQDVDYNLSNNGLLAEPPSSSLQSPVLAGGSVERSRSVGRPKGSKNKPKIYGTPIIEGEVIAQVEPPLITQAMIIKDQKQREAERKIKINKGGKK